MARWNGNWQAVDAWTKSLLAQNRGVDDSPTSRYARVRGSTTEEDVDEDEEEEEEEEAVDEDEEEEAEDPEGGTEFDAPGFDDGFPDEADLASADEDEEADEEGEDEDEDEDEEEEEEEEVEEDEDESIDYRFPKSIEFFVGVPHHLVPTKASVDVSFYAEDDLVKKVQEVIREVLDTHNSGRSVMAIRLVPVVLDADAESIVWDRVPPLEETFRRDEAEAPRAPAPTSLEGITAKLTQSTWGEPNPGAHPTAPAAPLAHAQGSGVPAMMPHMMPQGMVPYQGQQVAAHPVHAVESSDVALTRELLAQNRFLVTNIVGMFGMMVETERTAAEARLREARELAENRAQERERADARASQLEAEARKTLVHALRKESDLRVAGIKTEARSRLQAKDQEYMNRKLGQLEEELVSARQAAAEITEAEGPDAGAEAMQEMVAETVMTLIGTVIKHYTGAGDDDDDEPAPKKAKSKEESKPEPKVEPKPEPRVERRTPTGKAAPKIIPRGSGRLHRPASGRDVIDSIEGE